MKRQFLFAFCAFAALSLASCTKDTTLSGVGANTPSAEGEGIGYLALSIQTDQTRAEYGSDQTATGADQTIGGETFNAGDADEYKLTDALNAHVAVFFADDATKTSTTYFGFSYLTPRNNDKDYHTDGEGHDETEGDGSYSTSETLYTYITRDPRVSKNGVNPDYVLVMLNTEPARLNAFLESMTETTTLNEALQYLYDDGKGVWEGLYKNNNGDVFFTMTNSAYAEDTYNATLRVATPIAGDVYETAEEAAANPVTIFVERVVAKYSVSFYTSDTTSFTLKQTDTDSTPTLQLMAPADEDAKLSYVAEYKGGDVVYETLNWGAHIVNWGPNGLENNTFLYKNLMDANYNYTPLSGNWWSASILHRSYWAIDEHYNNAEGTNYTFGNDLHYYPSQYRPVYDYDINGTETSVDSWTDETIFADNFTTSQRNNDNAATLTYLPYNSLGGRFNHTYSLENTFAYEDALKGYNPLRYGTHVIVAAQLFFKGVDDKAEGGATKTYEWATVNGKKDGTLADISTKIYADGYYWAHDAYINWAYKTVAEYVANGVGHPFNNLFDGNEFYTFPSAMDEYEGEEVNGENVLFVKRNDKYLPIVYAYDEDHTAANSVLATDVFELNEAYLENGDGKRALTAKETVYYFGYTKYDDGTEEPAVEGSEDNYTKCNDTPDFIAIDKKKFTSIVMKLMPAGAKYYDGGRMYYAIPVKHIDNGEHTATLDKYDATADKGVYDLGDFGVVRNHWYKLNVKSITKPGTPVEDPDDPIIPNDPEEYDYIAVEIVILPWHVIDNDVYL